MYKERKHPCYRVCFFVVVEESDVTLQIMLWLAVVDMIALCASCICFGLLIIEGAVFCSRPWIVWIVGCTAMCKEDVSSYTSIIPCDSLVVRRLHRLPTARDVSTVRADEHGSTIRGPHKLADIARYTVRTVLCPVHSAGSHKFDTNGHVLRSLHRRANHGDQI